MRKVALVTGGSRGIGAATARALAAAGYAVCVNYIEQRGAAEAVVKELHALGVDAICHRADVAEREAVFEMVRRVERELGQVTLLVSNAGIARQSLFQDLSEDWWRRVFAVNVDGAFHAAQAVLGPMLRAHAGCLIFISSIWGQHGASCETAYAAAKHALIGLSRSLAAELAPSGIRVNAIAPGVIDTDMVQVLGRETLDALAAESIPLGRLGRPEEIARAVVYLAEQASYTTGQVLGADGGFFI